MAPTYPMTAPGWREIKFLAQQIPGTEVNLSERMVTLPGGGLVQVKSSDNPDRLRGEGLDFVVLDECAYMTEETWTESIRPALSDRKGGAIFISTPKGRNFFFRLFIGAADRKPEWQAWRYPTAANPFIDPQEIQYAKETLPERVFRQEYLAEFIDDAGGVFRGVRACIRNVPEGAKPHVIATDRMNKVEYQFQLGRLKNLVEKVKATRIVAEVNSMGDPLVSQLRVDLPNVLIDSFVTTAQSKKQIIESLALSIERQEISYPDIPAMINELEAYEYEISESGNVKYGAPSGLHDDYVMSLALAHWGWKRYAAHAGQVVIGVDWGRHEDFSVFTALKTGASAGGGFSFSTVGQMQTKI